MGSSEDGVRVEQRSTTVVGALDLQRDNVGKVALLGEPSTDDLAALKLVFLGSRGCQNGRGQDGSGDERLERHGGKGGKAWVCVSMVWKGAERSMEDGTVG